MLHFILEPAQFIEASDIRGVTSGGVKANRVEPTLKEGEGNVIFAREEFTSPRITAFFNLDLAQLRAFGLGMAVERMLIAIALYKVQRFLSTGLRLRTACDLDCRELRATRPARFEMPTLAELEQALPGLIAAVAATGAFAEPRVTTVTWSK